MSVSTKFKLLFEDEPDLQLDKFQQSLPPDFQVIKKDHDYYVLIKSAKAEDRRCQYLIDRELDRHFFLTGVKIRATMVRTKVARSWAIRYRMHGSLPDNVHPQNWNYQLPIQLRLWSIAVDTIDDLAKVILLYQIIELENLDSTHFPAYTDSTTAPVPLTECKFIRNLVAHSGNVSDPQLKLYCTYIGLPPVMLDITDSESCRIIAAKVPLMEMEAKNVIAKAL